MTRRLRPPAPLAVRCRPDGAPTLLRRAGRERVVTHVAATWVRPAAWWTDRADGTGPDPLLLERTYYRVIADGAVALEIFATTDGRWYLERIID